MNIAFFTPNLSNKGGVERATISLLNALVDNFANEVKVFLIVFNEDDYAFNLSEKVEVVSLGIINYKLQCWPLINRMIHAIKKNSIDIVISVEAMSLLFTFLPVYMMRKRPIFVVWEHFNFKNNNGRRIRDLLRILAGKKADMVVTLTDRDAKIWVKQVNPRAKLTSIYNVNPFEGNKSSYDINSKTAIAIGRYVDVKGFDRLINAWTLFENKYGTDNWMLQIVGYGENENELQNLINEKKSKSILLVDGTNNIETFYKNAGIYCMSSYFEGLPMTLIEAQNYALPSVAFDIYAGPSEILGCGSGVLIEDNNIEKYADALYELTSDNRLREKMSEAAIKNSEQYKGYPIAEKWINVLKNLLS